MVEVGLHLVCVTAGTASNTDQDKPSEPKHKRASKQQSCCEVVALTHLQLCGWLAVRLVCCPQHTQSRGFSGSSEHKGGRSASLRPGAREKITNG
jgi:hypothetical protein